MITFNYLVDFPFAPLSLKLGFETKERYATNRDYAFSLLQGQTNLIRLIKTYSDSYNSVTEKTVLHYRDYLLSLALQETLVNTQFADGTNAKLTEQAAKVWETYSYDQLWSYLSLNTPRQVYKYAGLLGTPAFWFTQVDVADYPIDLILNTCSLFWSRQGVDFTELPYNRISNLLTVLNPPKLDLELAAIAFTPTTFSRREFINPEDLQDLKYRILLGAYKESALEALVTAISPESLERITEYAQRCLSLAKPGGFLLCLQFLVVESLTLAAQLLTQLPVEYLNIPLTTLFKIDALESTRVAIAQRLSLAFDAYRLLAKYNAIADATAKSQQTYGLIATFLGSTSTSIILDTEPYRLPTDGYIGCPPMDINIKEPFASENYESLLGSLPKSDLLLAPDVFAGQSITFTTNTPAQLVQLDLGTANTALTQVLSSINKTTQVAGVTTGFAAFYASNSATSNVADYASYKADPTASNVVVTNFSSPTQLQTDGNLSFKPFQDYGRLFGLETNDTTAKPVPDTRRVVNAARDGSYYMREESAARGKGASKELTDIHLESELKVIADWAESIGKPLPPEYKKVIGEFQTKLLVLQQKALTEDYGSGNSQVSTTAREIKTALSFRFNSGTNFDVRANGIQFSAEHYLLQTNNFHNQATLYKGSHLYSWERAESFIVKQAQQIYHYAITNFALLAANSYTQTGNNKQYADYLSLEVGQDKPPISSNTTLSGTYGSFDLAVQQDFNIQTKVGQFVVRSNDRATIDAKQSLQLQAGNSFILASKISGVIQSGADLSMSALGITAVSGTGSLSLSSQGIANLSAPIVYIGIGAGEKDVEDLDAVPEDQASGVVTGGGGFDLSSISSIAGQVAEGLSFASDPSKLVGLASDSLGIDKELFKQISTGVGVASGFLKSGNLLSLLGQQIKPLLNQNNIPIPEVKSSTGALDVAEIQPFDRGSTNGVVSTSSNGIYEEIPYA
jgi:hypothetical protein